MKSIFKYSIITAISAATLFSCEKKPNPTPTDPGNDTGSIQLEFFNKAGSSSLVLNDQWYTNENGDSFTVSKFNYYISNIVLNGSNGTADYTEPESYHLVEHSATPADMSFGIAGVPKGTYKSVTFMIGVDSLRNVSGAQTGALDPALGNFWTWSTGYIMLKMEGKSPKSPEIGGALLFHCGGFSGANNVLKTITLDFATDIEVTATQEPHVHIEANLLALFKSPNVIDFAMMNKVHMPGAGAKKLADNYANMFSVTYAGL